MPLAASDHAALLDYDRAHVWHPYSSATHPAPTRLVVGAEGTRLHLADGRRVVDGMSSWWAAIHGYHHPVLDAALRTQADDFAHVMFGGLTHAPAVRLAERLVEIAPRGLEHVFLADSGSVSVEVALKLAVQCQRGRGQPERTRMLTVRGGYHGDTTGAMSVTDPVDGIHSMFAALLPRHVFAPRPPADDGAVPAWAAELETVAAAYADQLAAIVVEPLLQGAGGMRPYPADCLRVFRDVADRHDLLLVFDEIATGFGRTGTMFAAEAGGVSPDVMCVGKALTGGYLTLAAVLCTPDVARAVSASDSGVLMHGPTYMANPLACAVAVANLDLLATGAWEGQVAAVGSGLADALGPCRELAGVVDVRTLGAVGVVQLDHPVDVAAATEAALDLGVWLRPFRDLVYAMPPYVCSRADVAAIGQAITAAVKVA